MSVISVLKNDAYAPDELYASVSAHFETLGIGELISPDMRVAVKPNLLAARRPEAVATTHPELVAAVVKWLQQNGVSDITVADSPAGPYTPSALKGVYSACGYTRLDGSVRLNYDCGFGEVVCAPGFRTRAFNIIDPIRNADFIINVCKLKTHAMTGISAGIKNLFGVIPGLQKPEMHYRNPDPDDFAGMLIDLAETVSPGVTLIDAIDCMEGNGPGGGTPKHVGLTLASRDVFSLDKHAAMLMGIDPDSVPMLRIAKERGLIDAPAEIYGFDALPCADPFVPPDTKSLDFTGYLPRFMRRGAAIVMDKLIRPIPRVDAAKCIGCGKCAESCPQHIISMGTGKASISRKGCISCFCCQEMCPARAIIVKRKIKL
ncbi:MAG: DUF362 domain-containing protein [Oscillospiraceae bacterium]|nr:DUF362 domain-containing protein [Oscillospiraceae bacterium]